MKSSVGDYGLVIASHCDSRRSFTGGEKCIEDDNAQIEVNANVELVQKGRTMSIDQAFSLGRPRTLSVDSVDYTSMLTGEVEEEVATYVRKQRRNRNRRRSVQKK